MRTLTMTDEQLGEMLAVSRELGSAASRLAFAEQALVNLRRGDSTRRRAAANVREARAYLALHERKLELCKARVGAAS